MMKQRSLIWIGLAAIALTLSMLISNAWQADWEAAPITPFQIAQEAAETAPAPALEPGLLVSGTYEDPQGKFQVGILDGYSVSSAAGSPLFQASDGNLAYSVVRTPLSSDSPLSEVGLVEIAQQVLGRGEGFQTQTFSPVSESGLQITWTGLLSQGAAPPKPVSGTVLVKQQGAEAYLLVIASLEDSANQIAVVVSTLVETLVIL